MLRCRGGHYLSPVITEEIDQYREIFIGKGENEDNYDHKLDLFGRFIIEGMAHIQGRKCEGRFEGAGCM